MISASLQKLSDYMLGYQSVVRRSVVLLFLVVPGLLLNFALSLTVAAIAPAHEFGLFYAGLSAAAVFAAPSAIFAFYQARTVASIRNRLSTGDALQFAANLYQRYCDRGLVVVAVLFFAAAVTVPESTRAELAAWIVVAGIVISTMMVEMARGTLKGLQKFVFLGLLGLGWMAGRFLFGLGGVWITGGIWAGLVGVLLAGTLVVVAFRAHLRISVPPAPMDRDASPISSEWRILFVFGLGYTLVLAIAYLDVLLGALVLDDGEHGAYSIASVLPKGGFTLTLPVLQVVFPTIIAQVAELDGEKQRGIAFRGLALTALLSGSVAVVIYFGSDLFCGGPLSIGGCAPDTMRVLAVSVPAISLLRGLVLLKLAQGSDRHPLLLALPAAAFIIYELTFPPSAPRLSADFAVFTVATLVFYGLACLFSRNRGERRLTQ